MDLPRRIELVETEQRARRAERTSAASSPHTGSLTLATGTYTVVGVRKRLTGSERLNLQGTARLRLQN